MSRWGAALLGVLAAIACVPPAPPPEPPVEEPPPRQPPAKVPAFVLIGVDSTRIVPALAELPEVERRGIWVQLPGPRIGGVFTARFEVGPSSGAQIPICPAGERDDFCYVGPDTETLTGFMRVDARGRETWSASPRHYGGCECLVVEGLSTDDEPPPVKVDPEDLAMSPYDEAEYRERCLDLDEDYAPTAVVGANLYRTGVWSNGGCTGVDVVDAVGDAIALVPGERPLQSEERDTPPQCRATEAVQPDAALSEPQCTLGDETCETFCYHDDEAEAFCVRRGQLVHVTASASAGAGACTCVSPRPLTPDACPSPVEPCGDPSAFAGITDAEQFWVASDGSFALAGGGGTLDLRSRQGTVRTVKKVGALLGVHFVEDATPLMSLSWPTPEVVRPRWPEPSPSDAGFSGKGNDWANRCFSHLMSGRHDEAESACWSGLAIEDRARTRATLVYNLGRIAEQRGNTGRAIAFYERSLALRPGNEAVQSRLDGLTGG